MTGVQTCALPISFFDQPDSLLNSISGWLDEMDTPIVSEKRSEIDDAISDDLNTARLLVVIEDVLSDKEMSVSEKYAITCDALDILGLDFSTIPLTRQDLRIRPVTATITEAEIEAALEDREAARAAKDFATSDRIRDDLIACGVEVMDGDPLSWDWRIEI